MRYWVLSLLLGVACLGLACGDANPSSQTPVNDAGGEVDGDAGAVTPDAEPGAPDAAPEEEPFEGDPCDKDEDGFEAIECGGQDCDDTSRDAFPGTLEVCDELDNNCDGQLNEGLDCAFFAHSPNTLFKVDPFAKEMIEVGPIPSRTVDFDTSPDGRLWAINLDSLHTFNAEEMDWDEVGAVVFPEAAPNAFAINNAGVGLAVFLNHIYKINLQDGRLELGPDITGGFQSSGDVVVNKDGSFFMSARGGDFATDVLLLVDVESGEPTVIGEIGHNGVYGLTSAWNKLFGLTVGGQLLSIDLGTGAGEALHQFPTQWYGAASTPSR